jgi:tetratricopeptide (TPR) repeat protein
VITSRHRVAVVLAALCAACAHRPRAINPRAVTLQAAGAAALERGDLDGAAGQFSLALDYEPRMAEAHNGLGLVALRRGDERIAEDHFLTALDLNEDLAEAHLNLGALLLPRDQVAEALNHFYQALAIDPGFAAARLAAGEALLRLGRPEDARWELAKLCELQPRWAAAHAALALVLARVGRIAPAETAARRALALDERLAAGHRARAEILLRRGDAPGAVAELETALGQTRGNVDDRLTLAKALIAAGQGEAAERELVGLEKVAPRRPEVAFMRAFVALRREQAGDAIAAAQRALALRAFFPEARLVLAEALLRAGRVEEGRRELGKFLREAPDDRLGPERKLARQFLDRGSGAHWPGGWRDPR